MLGLAEQRAGRWGDLRTRTLSAALLGPIALLCIWLGAEAWTALMAAAALGLGLEWSALCGQQPWRMPAILVPAALLLGGFLAVLRADLAALAILVAGGAVVWRVSGRRSLAAGVIYVGVPLVALLWLRQRGPAGRVDVLFVVLVVWAADIGAYVSGRLLGGPKLAPSVSPGKTCSGSAGGLLAAMLVGVAAAHALSPGGMGRAAAAACVLGVVSQAGDLLESWIKRCFGVKDSGRLIPGHGGLLDRLDGLLAAAPAAALLAMSAGRGGALWN